MSTERLAPAPAPYPPSIAEAFARIMPPGVEPLLLFRTMARSARVLQRIFAGSLLDKGPLALRERELAILRTTARCGSEYEWGVHVAFFAARAGFDEQHIAATLARDIDAEAWSVRERLILQLMDDLHDNAQISAMLWQELQADMSPEQILELIALAGSYHTISYMTNGLALPLEAYSARFTQYLADGS